MANDTTPARPKTEARKQAKKQKKAEDEAKERLEGLRFEFSDGLVFHAADMNAWDEIQVSTQSQGRWSSAWQLFQGMQTFSLEAIGCMRYVVLGHRDGYENVSYQECMESVSLGELQEIGEMREASDSPT